MNDTTTTTKPRRVREAEDLDALVEGIFDPARDRTLFIFTSRPRELEPAMDLDELSDAIGDGLVWTLPTGRLTRELDRLLPPKLGVYNGAARIFWPGARRDGHPTDYPLIRDRAEVFGSEAERMFRRAVEVGPPPVLRSNVDPTTAAVDLEQRKAAGAEHAARGLATKLHDAETRISELEDELRTERARASRLREGSIGTRSAPAQHDALTLRKRLELGVFEAWRQQPESEQRDHPLRPFRLRPEFLDALDGLGSRASLAKVARVISRLASGQHDAVDQHQLRKGPGGSDPQRVRRRDGAKAWRVILERRTPDALRLHVWRLPGGGIEIAAIGGHGLGDCPE